MCFVKVQKLPVGHCWWDRKEEKEMRKEKEFESMKLHPVRVKVTENGLVRVITSQGKYDYVKRNMLKVYMEKGYVKALA